MGHQGLRNICSVLLVLLGSAAAPSFGQDARPLRAVEEDAQAGLKRRCHALETLISAERAASQPKAGRSMASSQAARRHFEAKVKAVNDGTPQPAREPSAMDAVSSSCRKLHGSRG